MKYTNNYDLSLSVAVWLAADDYDHSANPNEISTTSIIKPIRQLVLASRATEISLGDVSNNTASSIGTAIHNDINAAWLLHYKEALDLLGYSQKDITRIKINPTQVNENDIPIYMEQRERKKLGKYTISGKYDFIANGQLEDFKTTGVYTYINNSKIEDYRLQGSIYRWLNPNKITNDIMLIQYIFTNWEAFKVSSDKSKRYPPSKILSEQIQLMSIEKTEEWLKNKLQKLEKYINTPEAELPLCSDKDLWKTPSTYAYYKNPAKMVKCTKKFNDYYEAHNRQLADGGGGIVIERPGVVKACMYCDVRDMCSQKDTYIANGSLIL